MINNLRLGYPCTNETLGKQNIKVTYTCRYKTYQEKGVDYLKSLATKNLENMIRILEWNVKNNITLYRIYSDMFPHITNTKTDANLYTLEFASSLLHKIGEIAIQNKIRLTIHASEFCHLSSENKSTKDKTIKELNFYCDLLCNIFKNSKGWYENLPKECRPLIILHVGTIKPSKYEAMQRWIAAYKTLDPNLQKLIVVENDEFNYSPQDILPTICEPLNIPLIFDVFHFSINYGFHVLHTSKQELHEMKVKALQEIIPRILNIWLKRNLIPKFHLSEQQHKARVGTHGDTISTIPEFFLNAGKYIKIDVMLETKNKELSVLKMIKKYKKYK